MLKNTKAKYSSFGVFWQAILSLFYKKKIWITWQLLHMLFMWPCYQLKFYDICNVHPCELSSICI